MQWLATMIALIMGAGMSIVASQRIAAIQCRESPRMIAGIFYFLWYRQRRQLLVYCFLYLLLAFLLSSLLHLYPFSQLLLAGLSTLPLLLSNIAGTTLRGLRRADLLIMLQLFTVLLSLLLIVVAMRINGKPIEAFQLAFALASTLTLILAIFCVIRLLPLEKALQPGIFLKERLQHSLTRSRLAFFADAIIWQRGEFLLLAYHCTSTEIGFYILSSIISNNAIALAPFLLTNIVKPMKVSQRLRGICLNPYASFVKISCYLVFVAVPLCILFILFSPVFVVLCLGSKYIFLVVPLRIMLIATVFGSVATASVARLAALSGEHSVQVRLQFCIALLKIYLVLVLSAHWGVTGAAIASTLAQILSASHSILVCRHILLKREMRF